MKKLINLNAMSNLSKVAFGALLVLTFVLFSAASNRDNDNEKISVCHIPPGNTLNCHEINISMNALDAHLEHGDLIFCQRHDDYPMLLDKVHGQKDRIIKTYE